jgi:SRSO17 transposase
VHRERWQRSGIPEETPFTTKPALTLERLRTLVTVGTPRFGWVTCDEAFGCDTGFLDGVAALPRWYVAEVPHDTQVWRRRPGTAGPVGSGRGRRRSKVHLRPGEPTPQRVDPLAAAAPMDEWPPCLITEDSEGPLVAEFAVQREVAVCAGLLGPDVWGVLRRGVREPPELKVYLRNAPAYTPGTALVRVAGLRWPIETAFEERKGGLGLDHYEVRTWLGWHHHMTLSLLAHHFLARARQRVKKGRQR